LSVAAVFQWILSLEMDWLMHLIQDFQCRTTQRCSKRCSK
jgi:hypothetical protein